VIKVSPVEAFTEIAQQLLSITERLDTQVATIPPDDVVNSTTSVSTTSRERAVYSKEVFQTTSLDSRSDFAREGAKRRMDTVIRRIGNAGTSLEGCLTNDITSLQEDDIQEKAEMQPRDILSVGHHHLLKRLNTIEDKLDILLGTNRPLSSDALEARPCLNKIEEAPFTRLLLDSDTKIQEKVISTAQGVETSNQLIHLEDNAELATTEAETTECEMYSIAAQFPSLVPDKKLSPLSLSSKVTSDAARDIENSVIQEQPGRELIYLKRTPPTLTSSLDRSDGGKTMTPSRKRRLINLSSDDEEVSSLPVRPGDLTAKLCNPFCLYPSLNVMPPTGGFEDSQTQSKRTFPQS
jgi:hypothetical protein